MTNYSNALLRRCPHCGPLPLPPSKEKSDAE